MYFDPPMILGGWYYYYCAHFTEESNEAQHNKELTQSHTARKWQSWALNPGSLAW